MCCIINRLFYRSTKRVSPQRITGSVIRISMWQTFSIWTHTQTTMPTASLTYSHTGTSLTVHWDWPGWLNLDVSTTNAVHWNNHRHRQEKPPSLWVQHTDNEMRTMVIAERNCTWIADMSLRLKYSVKGLIEVIQHVCLSTVEHLDVLFRRAIIHVWSSQKRWF